MFKITATILKPGGKPVEWTRFSKQEMTLEQCKKIFLPKKEAGKPYDGKILIKNFSCSKNQ